MRGADRAGSRGDTRRVVATFDSTLVWFAQQVVWQAWVSAFGEGPNWETKCSTTLWDRETACTNVKMATLRATMLWRERDLGSLSVFVWAPMQV